MPVSLSVGMSELLRESFGIASNWHCSVPEEDNVLHKAPEKNFITHKLVSCVLQSPECAARCVPQVAAYV